MTTKAAVEEFLGQRTLALVGASQHRWKFGNAVLRELSGKGYKVLPIHRSAHEIDGHPTYASFEDLPEPVGGVVVVVPPKATESVVRAAATHGISRVWLQQGAASDAALAFCAQQGMTVVHGECILMFAAPTAIIHRIHRFIWNVTGKLPK